jgi:hypothetical protein
MHPKQLIYDELLCPTSRFMPILSPRYFPIHPTVYDSSFAYTPEFVNKILLALDNSVVEDVKAINQALGIEVKYEPIKIKDFYIIANPTIRSVDITYVGSNIAVQPGAHIEHIIENDWDLPPRMIGERALLFSKETDRLVIPSWYTHTPEENGTSVYLYLRNFAILFNNLGIEELTPDSK